MAKRFFALNAPPTECLCCNHVCRQRSNSGEQACSGMPYPRISPHFPPVFPRFSPFFPVFPRFPPFPPIFPHFSPFPPFSPFFRGPKKNWRLRGGRLPRPAPPADVSKAQGHTWEVIPESWHACQLMDKIRCSETESRERGGSADLITILLMSHRRPQCTCCAELGAKNLTGLGIYDSRALLPCLSAAL